MTVKRRGSRSNNSRNCFVILLTYESSSSAFFCFSLLAPQRPGEQKSEPSSGMKKKVSYKKKPPLSGKAVFAARRAYKSKYQNKCKMANLGPRAKILWSSAPNQNNSPSQLVHDKSWSLTYTHFNQLLADFSIKAGSKKMILASANKTSDGRIGAKLAESLLLKKYRYSFFLIAFERVVKACSKVRFQTAASDKTHFLISLPYRFFNVRIILSATSIQSASTSSASQLRIREKPTVQSPPPFWTSPQPTSSSVQTLKELFKRFKQR